MPKTLPKVVGWSMLLVTIIAAIGVLSVNADNNSAPDVEWDKTFGPVYGAKILVMNDGGYVIVGSTGQWVQARGPDGWREGGLVLIKIDSQGNAQWTKNYSIFGFINDATLTSDNGFAILSGRTLCKIDSQGILQWSKTYDPFPDRSDVSVTSAIQTSDGGFAIVGLADNQNLRSEGRFVKTDSEGNVLWNKTYGSPDGHDSKIYSVVETNDGYVFAGSTNHLNAGQQNIWLVKINHAGDIQWEKGYGDDQTVGECRSLIRSSDGGYVFSGQYYVFSGKDYLSCYVFKTDAAGNIQWKQNASISFSSIAQTKEGGYIFAGYNGDMGIVSKYSASGRLQWTQEFAKGKDAYILSVAIANDGGYVFAGYKGFSEYRAIWAVKIANDNLPMETLTPTATLWNEEYRYYLQVGIVAVVLVGFCVSVVLVLRRKAKTKS